MLFHQKLESSTVISFLIPDLLTQALRSHLTLTAPWPVHIIPTNIWLQVCLCSLWQQYHQQNSPINFISPNNIFFLQGFDSIQLPSCLVLGQQYLKDNRKAVLQTNLLLPYWITLTLIDTNYFHPLQTVHSQNQAQNNSKNGVLFSCSLCCSSPEGHQCKLHSFHKQ